jgi:hypothetical protein
MNNAESEKQTCLRFSVKKYYLNTKQTFNQLPSKLQKGRKLDWWSGLKGQGSKYNAKSLLFKLTKAFLSNLSATTLNI